MIRIAVCDNAIADMKTICSILAQYQAGRPDLDMKLFSFYSSQELSSRLRGKEKFQIYILDTVLEGISGLELAAQIRQEDRDAVILFVTAFKEYALDAFQVFAQQYLLKPIDSNRFINALDYAISFLGNRQIQHINIKTKEGIIAIPLHTIVYVECISHVLYFHLVDHTTITSIHIRSSFETVASPLLDDERFSHPHKSYIVNMDHVQKMTGLDFMMWDGTVIPISRKKFPSVKNQYLTFLSMKQNSALIPSLSSIHQQLNEKTY